MIATVVNTITVVLGSSIGLVIKKGIPKKITDQCMKALGLCSIFIGISGSLKGENTLVMIISMVVGTCIGEAIDIDKRVNQFVYKIENKFKKKENGTSIAEGFINASLLFCIGSMTVVGALNAGLLQDYTMLYTKSTLDFCSSIIFASTLGIGVLFSAGFVLLYQGGLTLLASAVAPLLSTAVVNEMTCVGSLIIIATGFNLLGVTKLKLLNYLPAMFLPILLCLFM